MDELTALIGQHWRLLLVYPGGITALAGCLLARVLLEQPLRIWRGRERWNGREIVIAAVWLLTIALLPLPQTGWPYDLDLIVLLLLIELPHWAKIIGERDQAPASVAAQLAPLLNIYPLLVLSVAAIGQGAGSLVAQEINRAGGWLHWAGIVGWASTLPPLLGLGPWQERQPSGTLPTLRRVAHMGLLLATALPAHDQTPRIATVIGYGCILLPLALLNRWWRHDADRWKAWQPWLVVIFALLVGLASGQTLLDRLR